MLCVTQLVATSPNTARAAAGDCVTIGNFDNALDERTYVINSGSYSNLPGVTQNEWLASVKMAADAWNEQANAGTFRYAGTTSQTSLPPWDTDCAGYDHNIVVAVD